MEKTFSFRGGPLHIWEPEDDKATTPPETKKYKSVYDFDANLAIEQCTEWIKDWYEGVAGPNSKKPIVIGMSGGKDSTICAALLVKALGKDRVIGVSLPTHGGNHLAREICKYLEIHFDEYLIGSVCDSLENSMRLSKLSETAITNIPPRIRMTYLYAYAQSVGGYVVNTCNLSEDWIGYSTIFGDLAGAFAPLAKLTVTEIRIIGHTLGLPDAWVNKTPSDDLPYSCGDEEKFGFSYDELDRYIRTGAEPIGYNGKSVREKIDNMHKKNKFKLEIVNIPAYNPETYCKTPVNFS